MKQPNLGKKKSPEVFVRFSGAFLLLVNIMMNLEKRKHILPKHCTIYDFTIEILDFKRLLDEQPLWGTEKRPDAFCELFRRSFA